MVMLICSTSNNKVHNPNHPIQNYSLNEDHIFIMILFFLIGQNIGIMNV